MKKIFITGATGLIGSYITKYLLKEKHEIVALCRPESDFALLNDVIDEIEWAQHSIFDVMDISEILKRVDTVVHCAGKISVDKNDLYELMETNMNATRLLVDLSLENKVKQFVHVSSVAAIGRNKVQKVLDENSPWTESESNSDYAYSKMLGEQEVWRGYYEGLNAIIINPSFVLGAGFWDKGTSGLVSQIKKYSKYYPVGSNGFVDVRDVAQICLKAINSDVSGERIIVNGVNLSYKSLFAKYANELEVNSPELALKGFVSTLMWNFDKLRSTLSRKPRVFTKQFSRRLSSNVAYNNEKSIKIFEHSYLDIDKTIKEIVGIYKESTKKDKRYGVFV